MHQSISLDWSDHSHASSLRVRFTPCGGCCGVLSRFPLQNWKDPLPQIQGDGGPNFQLSPGEVNENLFFFFLRTSLFKTTASSWDSSCPMNCWCQGIKGIKSQYPGPNMRDSWKASPDPELFAANASQFGSFLCSVRLPSFPNKGWSWQHFTINLLQANFSPSKPAPQGTWPIILPNHEAPKDIF